MEYTYSWDPGTPSTALRRVDAAAFAQELEQLERQHGAVTSPLLTDVAKDPNHIAHDFVYHVSVKNAARLHYEQRAGLLLRSLRIAVADESLTTRARIAISAVSDTGSVGDRDRFLTAQEVASRSDLRDLHRGSLLRRMNLLRQELLSFDEFAAVVAAIDQVMEQAA